MIIEKRSTGATTYVPTPRWMPPPVRPTTAYFMARDVNARRPGRRA